MDTVLPSLFLQVILIASNAFFAMSEFAVVSVNTQKMKRLAEGGSKPAARLLVITEAPSDFLATIQVGVTLSGFLASAAAADSFADPLVSALSFIPIPASTLRGVTVFLITIILSYFMLIFGELAPKRIAMKNPDGVALKVVGVIWALNKVCKPVIKLIAASTNLVLRPLGIGPASDEEPVAEEDILMMVEAGEETGTVDEREHEMIKNIFEFDDRKVSEIMTHRTDVVGVPVTATLQDIVALQAENRFSRIPVYKEDLDDIVGAVFVKDLVPLLEPGRYADATPEKYMRSVLYVPEGMTCSNLLHAFQKARVHLAIVVDEYGGTEGMVTMEDLLETIVGDITREMTEIFVREFARINEYFGATFTEMFGGGKASLELEDEKEPLSCGIEIKVQPPGKQLKTITLLSGGEKAFVAIALYFAILKVRPTPFCMLDEIDAALDDRNVERFAAYLHRFSGKTQFIVITHRRGTMEAADVLYGVTMQEQGISKILHLDLDELQKQLGITA